LVRKSLTRFRGTGRLSARTIAAAFAPNGRTHERRRTGILAADAMEACGLDVTELSPTTVDELRPLFPRKLQRAHIPTYIFPESAARALLTLNRHAASVICRISELAIDCPDVVELDVNPLLARASGALALDARVSISSSNSPTGASARRLP
jgi:hypothetical protein